MSYVHPKEYECGNCNRRATYTPSDGVASVPIVDGAPACPYCWSDFVKKNVPIMEPVTNS